MSSRNVFFLISLMPICLLLVGCVSDLGGNNAKVQHASSAPGTVFRNSELVPSAYCPNGGLLLEIGLDDNGNGVLDSDEVRQSYPVCHGQVAENDTLSPNLIELSAVMPGQDSPCPHGGTRIEVSQNGVLETAYLCTPPTAACEWQAMGDGTVSVQCGPEQTYVLLEPEALAFTESITCVISIDNPRHVVESADESAERFPLIYSVNKMGTLYKYVTLTISDGRYQFSNTRLLAANQGVQFELSFIQILYDMIGSNNGGYFSALLSEADNLAEFAYFDRDLLPWEESMMLVLSIPAFSWVDETGQARPGACSRSMPL